MNTDLYAVRPAGAVTATLLCAVVAWLAGCSRVADQPKDAATATVPAAAPAPAPTVEELEAAVAENPLKDAYFGETHVHTSFSLDAYIGGARITPDEAYKFAQGGDVVVNGQKHNIGRPLDWVAVSDHAEFIGEMYSTQVPGAKGGDNPMLEELRGLKTVDEQRAWFMKYVINNMRGEHPDHPPFYAGPETTRSAWKDVEIKAAIDNYRPGKFTTLAGFEWTSAQNAGNMHRNVIFRDLNVPDMPLSALDTNDEEKLWAWMAEQEKKGSRLLAIPHNSNGSKGLMFEPLDNSGKPITADYARLRSHFERLIEMMQIKGNSEVYRTFWPADEFAGFENADSVGTFSGRTFKKENFVRWAVTKGLDYQTKLGVNPYQLGFIGGTDNHNGLPSDVAEDDYIGSHGPADGTLEARRKARSTAGSRRRSRAPARFPPSGRHGTRALQSGTRWLRAKRSSRRARASRCGSSVARTSAPRRRIRVNSWSRAIAMACRWAARSRRLPRRRRSRSGRQRTPTARTSIESRSSRAWSTRTASRTTR